MDPRLFGLLIFYPLLLFCLSVHESAHAWTADRFGDDTARLLGRVTLNPIPHMDLIGTVFLPIMSLMTGASLIGWGKPVPVNPNRFKNPRYASLWVAAAGPLSNIAIALLFAGALHGMVLVLSNIIAPESMTNGALSGSAIKVLATIFYVGVQLNLVLAFFNMIPCFPLDGGTVLRGLLPHRWVPAYDQFSRYSVLILLGLFVSGLLRYVLIPVNFISQILLPS